LGLAGGIGLAVSTSSGFEVEHLYFAILALVPAVLCYALSVSIKHRHIATVPITILLCFLSAYVFIGDPSSAAQGLSPYLPILIGAWIVMVLEAIAIISVIWFVLVLWRKGAFA